MCIFVQQFNKVVEFATELSKKYTTSDLLEEYLKELSDTDIKKNTQSLATETLKPDDTTQQTLSHLDKYMMVCACVCLCVCGGGGVKSM